jgi:hypothetical protein
MRSCSSAAMACQLRRLQHRAPCRQPAGLASCRRYSTTRSTRRMARPQLWAMSVALEAQGETVPRRGVTTTSGPSPAVDGARHRSAARRAARARRRPARGRSPPGARSGPQAGDLGMHRLQARQELLDPEVAEGLAALELGDVQGHCAGAWSGGGSARAADWGPGLSGISNCAGFCPSGIIPAMGITTKTNRASWGCAPPAGWRPRCWTTSRPTSSPASPPARSTGWRPSS